MDAQTVQAETRIDFGKGAARKLRATGRIPVVVYRAGADATHLTVDPNELQLMFRRAGNPNLLVNLQADGKSHICVIKDAQKHPVSRALLHIDFFEVNAKEEIAVEVLVRTTGKAQGETFGGRIKLFRRTLRVAAIPANIPAEILIDVTRLNVDDYVRAGDIKLGKGVSLAIHEGTNILMLSGKRAAALALEAELDAAAAEEGASDEAGASDEEAAESE